MKIRFEKSDWSSSSKKALLNVSLGSKSGKDYFFTISISASYTSSYSGKTTIKIHVGSSIKITSRVGSSSTTYTLPSEIKRDLLVDRIRDDRGRTKYVISGEDFSAIEAFYDMIQDIVRHISEKELIGEYTYDKTTGTRSYDATGTLAPLRIDRTLQNLQKDKPLAHCIARAIQLLDTRPIEGGKALSYVCKSKFMESRSTGHTGPSRSGIPEIGSSLNTSPGMAALSQLFFDVVRFGMTDIKMSDLSLMQYEAFLKEMSKLVDTTDAHPKKLEEVKNRKGCDKSGYSEKDIIVPKDAVPSVLKKVSELYTAQLQHNANAMAILNQLFLIERDSPRGIIRNIYIHPNIFKRGIAEVERLNIITRNVLIKYYTNCERIYQEGAEIAKVSSGIVKSGDKPDGLPGAKPGIVAKPGDLPGIPKGLTGIIGRKPDESKITTGLPGAMPSTGAQLKRRVQWASEINS
jgi:hypothetical protein